MYAKVNNIDVVPYIGTWIETIGKTVTLHVASVVPYIGTWIETVFCDEESVVMGSYLI